VVKAGLRNCGAENCCGREGALKLNSEGAETGCEVFKGDVLPATGIAKGFGLWWPNVFWLAGKPNAAVILSLVLHVITKGLVGS
jgi:hypothetical protein